MNRVQSRIHAVHEAAEADMKRVRDELRDRLNRVADWEALARELAHRDPDLVNDVLDQQEVPR